MRRRALLAALCSMLVLAVRVGAAADGEPAALGEYRRIAWKDLVPGNWKPREIIDRAAAASLRDEDESARAMLLQLRQMLDNAPVVETLDGVAVRMPGYVVPLEQGRDGLREFLLVPYYGACIHQPPPPANQIVHVRSSRPVPGFQSMSTVWVHGTIRANRRDNGVGVSGYDLELARMEPYRRE